MVIRRRDAFRCLILIVFVSLSAGCGKFSVGCLADSYSDCADTTAAPTSASTSPNTIQPGDGGEKGLSVSLLNYTDVNIGPVYVDGVWAGSMGKHLGSPGDGAGSAVMPAKWRADYKLKISWSDDELYKKDPDKLYTRMVPLEPYGPHDGGILWVAFFPHGVIQLYASSYFPGNPRWPGKKMPPETQCWLDGFDGCPVAARPEGFARDKRLPGKKD